MYEYKATLLRVVDGDTVDCLIDLGFDVVIRERVRLFGIDAPETRTRDLEEKKRGNEAKDFVIQQLENQDGTFVIETEYQRGKYGRTLGTIYLNNGKSLNKMLVEQGYANPY